MSMHEYNEFMRLFSSKETSETIVYGIGCIGLFCRLTNRQVL